MNTHNPQQRPRPRLSQCLHLIILMAIATTMLTACGAKKSASSQRAEQPVGPAFNADSALWFCQQQCNFGPRTMNSAAHDSCGAWIASRFAAYGMSVSLQKATLTGYDGTPLSATNITAKHNPQKQDRILLCAHWDSRPWADNDPNPDNWRTPVMAANDGASGVAVMLEIARLLQTADSLNVGVDFVCFDAEDWGTPQWAEQATDADTWALGAQHWAAAIEATPDSLKPNYRFGVLLDMVGGQAAQFYQEQLSKMYAPQVVKRVWTAAQVVGYGSFFPKKEGGGITDDHLPVNQKAGIPCIDIIPYYPDCQASSFGPTWHTVDDDMAHIDPATLKAVGQTVVQVLFTEE